MKAYANVERRGGRGVRGNPVNVFFSLFFSEEVPIEISPGKIYGYVKSLAQLD